MYIKIHGNVNALFVQKKALGTSKSCRNGKYIENCFAAMPLFISKLQIVSPGGRHEDNKLSDGPADLFRYENLEI